MSATPQLIDSRHAREPRPRTNIPEKSTRANGQLPEPSKPKSKKKGEGCGSGHANYKVKQVVRKLLSDEIMGIILAEYGPEEAHEEDAKKQADPPITQAVKDTIASMQEEFEQGTKLIDGLVQKFIKGLNGCARTIVAHPEFLRRLKVAAERHEVALQHKEKREASARSGNLKSNGQPKLNSSHSAPSGASGKRIIRTSHRGLTSKKADPKGGHNTIH